MSNQFIGEIRMFGGGFAPAGWALCNGQTLGISQNTALFSLIGTTYGGDGVQNFLLPNLQGRLPMGEGQGVGLTSRTIGEAAGTENVTLLTGNLPNHNHALDASTVAVNATAIGTTVLPGKFATGHFYVKNVGTPAPTFGIMNPKSVASSGGNLPHSNLMPTLCVSFIIALTGLFPSRN